MRLPVNTDSLTFTLIGDPTAVLDFDTKQPKYDKDGKTLTRIPVLIGGTGERYDVQATVTVAGSIPALARGHVAFRNLTISTWSLRTADGRERTGVSFRADSVDQA